MKKRIFISVHAMRIGGVETSLIGLLQSLDYSRVDVDLFVFSHEGEFMNLIPKEVNLLPEILDYKLALCTWKDSLRAGKWRLSVAQFISKARMWLYVRRNRPKTFDANYSYMGACLNPVLPDVGRGEYDLALSFLDPHNFVLSHVRAKKKLGWIHSDYTTIDVNRKLEAPVWGSLDNVVAISEDVRRTFVSVFPNIKDKIILVENILNPIFARRRADEFMPPEYSEIDRAHTRVLCSLGRICYQKNFDNLPRVARYLKDRGVDFRWFVLGPGNADEIEVEAKRLGVDRELCFIGPRSNPYPYVKNCDVYVQPSRFEGKSVAVREAQILGKPVVVTNYPTASSQVNDGVDGLIVPLDNEAIAEGLYKLLNSVDLQNRITTYLQSHNYGNVEEVGKIYGQLEDVQ